MIQLKQQIPLVFTLLLILTLPSVSRADEGEIKVDVLTKTTEMWDGEPLPKYPQGQPEVTMLGSLGMAVLRVQNEPLSLRGIC